MRQIEGPAADQPVLLIFEDAHWADPTSIEFLNLAIERIRGFPVLLIVTFRPEFQLQWSSESHVTVLFLNRLDAGDTADFVQRVAGRKALPPEIVDQIVRRTDGVPLFIEELTRTVLESGVLREEEDQYRLDGPLPSMAIPSTLQASLLARLDRLAPTREIAQVGAAIGREFPHRLLSLVADRRDAELQIAITRLIDAGLVSRRGLPPQATYMFKHALVQDAAYATLLRGARQTLHARIAAVLEQHFDDIVQTQPELLARHHAEAMAPAKATPYWPGGRMQQRASRGPCRGGAVARARAGGNRRTSRSAVLAPAGPRGASGAGACIDGDWNGLGTHARDRSAIDRDCASSPARWIERCRLSSPRRPTTLRLAKSKQRYG